MSGQTQNEVHEQGREMCKKIPNKRTIELQKDKFKQYNFKRFPVNKKFSEAFEELMKSSISKVPGRVKKWNLNLKKTPFPSSEGDTEPTNEWLDASQSAGSKIPTEFKPKPKMKLKIYHLRCKKKSNENPWGKKIKKRCALYKSLGYDNFGKAIHISKDEG